MRMLCLGHVSYLKLAHVSWGYLIHWRVRGTSIKVNSDEGLAYIECWTSEGNWISSCSAQDLFGAGSLRRKLGGKDALRWALGVHTRARVSTCLGHLPVLIISFLGHLWLDGNWTLTGGVHEVRYLFDDIVAQSSAIPTPGLTLR